MCASECVCVGGGEGGGLLHFPVRMSFLAHYPLWGQSRFVHLWENRRTESQSINQPNFQGKRRDVQGAMWGNGLRGRKRLHFLPSLLSLCACSAIHYRFSCLWSSLCNIPYLHTGAINQNVRLWANQLPCTLCLSKALPVLFISTPAR